MSEPARRFYKSATTTERDGRFAVALDERPLKTAKGAALHAPTRALADAVAAEWNAQTDRIEPATMPITQLAFAAIDWTAPSRAERAAYVASFGATDLCCHRANSPRELVARQAQAWDPLVAWGRDALAVALPVVEGIVAADIAPEALSALKAQAEALDDFSLTALSQAAGLSGSALIAFALVSGRLSGAEGYRVATLDDEFSLERWGEDAEGRARLDRVRAEFDALGRFVAALRA
ncbi:MAG: ATPase [Proteobacteria bacterium]|nr:ATPase [Pseudomonadota bacterium]